MIVFSKLDKDIIKIGLCYNMQILPPQVPTDTYDIPVNYIITEKGLIDCAYENN